MNKIKDFLTKFKKNTYSLKLSSKNKISILEQLMNLLQSWIPLLNSFKIMMYQTKDKKIKKFLSNIIEILNKWNSLKDAFSKYPHIFWVFDIVIIEMWETIWKLWDSIETIKNKEEKAKELKWKVLSALVYPIVIVILSTCMVIVFMIYVIPKITDMYKDAKVNLPDLTAAVIKISDFIQAHIFNLIIGFFVFIFIINTFRKHPKTKIYWDYFLLKIPIFWTLIKKRTLILFTSSLWILLKNGVIITRSLEITSRALENDYYELKLKDITSRVSKWIELSTLMWVNEIQNWKENFLFPIELVSVIKIWEETWTLPKMLLKISTKMNKDIEEVIKNIQVAIEPTVIILVWWIVWTLIMAIMLPFFNMVNVI